MSTSRPDETLLRLAQREAHQAKSEQLSAILTRSARLQRWLAQPIDPELRGQLRDDRQRLANELLEVLIGWADLGGTLTLGAADMDAERSPVSLAGKAVFAVVGGMSEEGALPEMPARLEALAPAPLVESLKSLARHFDSGPPVRAESVGPNWEVLLAKVAHDLGAAGDEGESEVQVLQNVVREADRWRTLPREVQRTLVGLITARLRRAQDELGVSGPRLDDTFSMLSAWSKREQPGWVNGLSRGHAPTRGSWSADAEAYRARLPRDEAVPAVRENLERLLLGLTAFLPEFDSAPEGAIDAVGTQFKSLVRHALENGLRHADPRLIRLCVPHAALFDDREFRALRKSLRDDAESAEADDDDRSPPLPPDWAWWGRTRHRRGVLVGGDPREVNRERLEHAFGFAELDWVGADFKRNNLQTVRDRVRAGKLDLVIILGSFVGHDADDVILPAARECAVDWVHVDKGYGIVRVRRAIERFLDPLTSR